MTRLEILNSIIPVGGRRLTSTERRALRSAGHRGVSNHAWVMPTGDRFYGTVYYPREPRTFIYSGIQVTTHQQGRKSEMQYQRTIEGVQLQRSIRSTKNYEWCGVIGGEGVRFIPTVGWRSQKPMYWLPCNRNGRALDPGFHGRGFTTLKVAVQKAKSAIEKERSDGGAS